MALFSGTSVVNSIPGQLLSDDTFGDLLLRFATILALVNPTIPPALTYTTWIA
jgi:hypothetical protein